MSSYEEKMKALSECKPEEKDRLLYRILKGERHVKITGDEDIFFQVNKDRVSLQDYTERDKFKAAAEAVKQQKETLHNNGYSKDKRFRLIGEIPAEIFFSRPEFSPMLPKEERDRNIRKFLNEFNAFRITDGRL